MQRVRHATSCKSGSQLLNLMLEMQGTVMFSWKKRKKVLLGSSKPFNRSMEHGGKRVGRGWEGGMRELSTYPRKCLQPIVKLFSCTFAWHSKACKSPERSGVAAGRNA